MVAPDLELLNLCKSPDVVAYICKSRPTKFNQRQEDHWKLAGIYPGLHGKALDHQAPDSLALVVKVWRIGESWFSS